MSKCLLWKKVYFHRLLWLQPPSAWEIQKSWFIILVGYDRARWGQNTFQDETWWWRTGKKIKTPLSKVCIVTYKVLRSQMELQEPKSWFHQNVQNTQKKKLQSGCLLMANNDKMLNCGQLYSIKQQFGQLHIKKWMYSECDCRVRENTRLHIKPPFSPKVLTVISGSCK